VKANHYELGVRARPLPWLGLDFALFRTDGIDDIFSVSPTGTTGLFLQNVGHTRRQGVELGAHASLTKQWTVHVNYTYTEATFRDDFEPATPRLTGGCAATPCVQAVRKGNDLPRVPRHRLNAGVAYRATPWLTLWLSGADVGAQRLRGDKENVEPKLFLTPAPPLHVVGGLSYRF
jgi:iron complex outermembrane receptor protein